MGVVRFGLPVGGVAAARVCVGVRVPGLSVGVWSGARRFAVLAGRLRAASAALNTGVLSAAGVPGGVVWGGSAQRVFAESVRARLGGLGVAAGRYEAYAAALAGYGCALDSGGPRLRWLQAELSRRLAAAEQATGSGSAAGSAGAVLRSGFGGAADPAAGSGVEVELAGLAWQFKGAYDRWADALDRCLAVISAAEQVAPDRDRHGLSAALAQAAQLGSWLMPIPYLIAEPSLAHTSACLSRLGSELSILGIGLLFLCPPAGLACLTVATVLAGAQLAVDLGRRERGEHVSNSTLGLDAMAAVPIGGRAALGLREGAQGLHELPPAARMLNRLVPGGGLATHETAGGHTLAKHVGKTYDYLAQRLSTEPGVQAASTFYDREVAENTIAQLLSDNTRQIARWLRGTAGQLPLEGSVAPSVGFVVTHVGAQPVGASTIRVILRRSAKMPDGFRIHTAMVKP